MIFWILAAIFLLMLGSYLWSQWTEYRADRFVGDLLRKYLDESSDYEQTIRVLGGVYDHEQRRDFSA